MAGGGGHGTCRATVVVLTLTLAGCGSNSTAPTPVSVAGTWAGTATIVNVTGGECFAPGFAPFIGTPGDLLPFLVSQTADTVASDMPLILPLLFGGRSCAFSGTVTGAGALTLAAAANCATVSPQRCAGFSRVEGDTRIRDIRFVTATFSGSTTGNTMSANLVETWNLLDTDTQTSVGQLAVTSRWNLIRAR
jgi:hypothetical protein